MNKFPIAFFLPLLIFLFACDNQNPETAADFLTRQAWRPFQFEAPNATESQKSNYEAFLSQMRISYDEDGTYIIEFVNGLAPDESGSWALSANDSILSHFPTNGPEKQMNVEDLQLISFVYSLQDSIDEVTVFCVAE